ncbi:MAG: cytochrome c peroxidase [Bacteroidota bacterium]
MKNRNAYKFFFLALGLPLLLNSCLKDSEEVTRVSYSTDEYEVLSQTLDLPQTVNDYDGFDQDFFGVPTDHRGTLGRVLFYDPALSANNAVSCASCHHQEHGFADPVAKSEGFEGLETRRNSLMLTGGIEYYSTARFFWDERAETVEDQIRMTLTDHIEMGADLATLPKKFDDNEAYRILFRKAYGDEKVTSDRIVTALADFVASVNSTNSRYEVARNTFSQFEEQGVNLYSNNCQGCHGDPRFGPFENTANNGLDLDYSSDRGLAEVSNNPQDEGKFKVPLLKNVALTGPYMHDGRFATLEDVVDHYSEGIQAHPNVGHQLRDPLTGQVSPMNFTDEEKDQLIAFLHTLTDESFKTEPKWSDPFK